MFWWYVMCLSCCPWACARPAAVLLYRDINVDVSRARVTLRDAGALKTHVPVAGHRWSAQGSGWDSGNWTTFRRCRPRSLQLSQHRRKRKQRGTYQRQGREEGRAGGTIDSWRMGTGERTEPLIWHSYLFIYYQLSYLLWEKAIFFWCWLIKKVWRCLWPALDKKCKTM